MSPILSELEYDELENTKLVHLKKMLLYKSTHRGCKETDLILGGFAVAYIDSMSYSELVEFERILLISDNDIYDFVIKKLDIPSRHRSSLLDKIIVFMDNQAKK